MIKFILSRPIAVFMVYLAAVILGVIAYQTLPVSLMPDIPIPEITVQVSFKNTSARELENIATTPLRMQLMQVAHLTDIKSETRDGIGTIRLKFDYGTNIDYAYIEVNEKIDASMNSLPREMERPRVIKTSATDIPVFYLNLSLKSNKKEDSFKDSISVKFIELSTFAESVIRKRIEQLPEVAMVDLTGTVSQQITIEPDRLKMESLGLTISDIENILNQNNLSPANLMIRDGYYQYNIRFNSILRTRDDVEKIYFNYKGKVMQLRDIAQVRTETRKRTGMFVSNGKMAINMAVIKQADARMAEMKDKIAEMVKNLETDYPDIQFETSQDQTQLLDYSISNLQQNLTQGLLLVTLIVFLFLQDLKTPVLIGITLLVSVVICMLFFKLAGLSVNIISLAGLILAAGNMIDNSIVVTDNITQYRERSYSVVDSCITGTNEVVIPMLSSMLTNVAVFIPLIFLSGIAGALLFDEAISVTIGLSVSYLVGITLMPVLYKLFNSKLGTKTQVLNTWKEKIDRKISKVLSKVFNIEKAYEKGFKFVFKYKKISLLITFITIPLAIVLFWYIKKEKMPAFQQVETFINVDWNENIHVDENKQRTFKLIHSIQSNKIQTNLYIGNQQFILNREYELGTNESRIYINAHSTQRLDSVKKNITLFFKRNYPRAKFNFEPPASIFEKLFTTGEAPLIGEISNTKNDVHIELAQAESLSKMFNRNKLLKTKNTIPKLENIVLDIDLEKLLLYKIPYDAVIKELKTAFKENNVGVLRSSQQYIPIVISGKEKLIHQIFNEIKVNNSEGISTPLQSLLKTTHSQDYKSIFAGKNGEFIPFDFFPNSNDKEKFMNEIKNIIHRDKDLEVQFSGTLIESDKFINEFIIILCISILLLYFIMAAQFESLVQPLLVIMEIPVDVFAALLFMQIFGQSLNIMSAIGIVIMTGIVINDSILKLDVINQLRKEGMPLMEAIKTGGHRRLRAIIMTGLTSVLAMVPLLWGNDMGSELQKPFSVGLIGGMIIGTLVSLYIVPLIYWYIYRKSEEVKKF